MFCSAHPTLYAANFHSLFIIHNFDYGSLIYSDVLFCILSPTGSVFTFLEQSILYELKYSVILLFMDWWFIYTSTLVVVFSIFPSYYLPPILSTVFSSNVPSILFLKNNLVKVLL